MIQYNRIIADLLVIPWPYVWSTYIVKTKIFHHGSTHGSTIGAQVLDSQSLLEGPKKLLLNS
ncbi:hypothetical protein Misp06_00532 [Microbulbifer sp. NBRC 101763]